MNDFESRGQIENDITNLYNKYTQNGVSVIGNEVQGLVLLMGSY